VDHGAGAGRVGKPEWGAVMITLAIGKGDTCAVFCTKCDTVYRRDLSKVEGYIFIKYEMTACPCGA
jgi:hypothetical protein